MGRVRTVAPAFMLGGLLLVLLPGVAASSAPFEPRSSDFNGDGYGDLAVGAPGEAVGAKRDAGAVNVLYGSASGLTSAGDQAWTQDSPGVGGRSESGDYFGAGLATSDFDGDSYADLAIGAPVEHPAAGQQGGGAINVLYGSARGLTAAGDQMWMVGASGMGSDSFGVNLVAGDFDADGFGDLVVGLPSRTVAGVQGAGALQVRFGGPGGLTSAGALTLSQASPGLPGEPGRYDQFGGALASGDLDGDGYDDLAIGIPGEVVDGQTYAGAVLVMSGGTDRFTDPRIQEWSQASPGVEDAPDPGGDPGDEDAYLAPGDNFGAALAIGNFDGAGGADLAIGARGEVVTGDAVALGAVHVLYGSSDLLLAAGSQFWHEEVAGVPGSATGRDWFGASLAAGDLDGDAIDDLAVGIPLKGFGSQFRAGALAVLYGSSTGLTAIGSQSWSQASAGVPGAPEFADQFAWDLAVADLGRGAAEDLVIGVPRESIGSVHGAGMAHVLFGTPAGLSTAGTQAWSQQTSGVLGRSEQDDVLGLSLAP
jgi:hypothetical protein